jgi:chlorobactene glucosyltransferase
MSLPWLVILSTVIMVAGIYITWLLHARTAMPVVVEPDIGRSATIETDDLPMISVIIPARNEERNIRRCVQSLLTQTYSNYEVIIVDDRSSDRTLNTLDQMADEQKRLQVVHGMELPEGWAGKPHALVQGVAAARGEWLCFMDADTFADPRLLRATYQKAVEMHADMFSILTSQELGSFWERTVLPLVFLGLSFGFPAERVNDPSKPDAIANGQFILIKQAVYQAVGGHTAVKDRIDEDKALAVLVKSCGYHLVVADGRKLASTRMYTCLPEMWEGWTKNIYLGLRDRLGLLAFGGFVGVVVSIGLPFWLLAGLAWFSAQGGLPAGVVAAEASALWAYLLYKRRQVCNEFSISPGYALTFPLGALVFTAMMIASAVNVISGHGVSWKGRIYHS